MTLSRVAACLLTVHASALPAETIDTTTIAASALSPSCIAYRPVGVCLWLVCTPFGCKVRTSVKVGHYNPDLVVSSYNGLAGNPWLEMRSLLAGVETGGAAAVLSALGGPLPDLFGGGIATDGVPGRPDREQPNHTDLIFKDVDAIGFPLASLAGTLGSGYVCPSQANSFQPYFLSALDAVAWRWSIPEVIYPQSWIPGMREIGQFPLNTWGAVYPRSGFTTQAEDPKAAAVTAQRAGDVVTRTLQPHVYISLGSGQEERKIKDRMMVWMPGALKEGDPGTGQWQMLLPKQSKSCETFGQNDTLAGIASWAGGKGAESGDYAWTLWRPYKCCQVKGAFIGAIDFREFPP